ncbi:peptidylprolyl isomerase [Pseudazoarcus pumilus]|uniref:Chaperone SurA n=1 Tax=Pseudazoarcus pumilus TaxID=2067960 RepID=A0A2I6SAQ3_9RHOO|nr:molecular chaperone SurA [Pseudazoarcus pumilus]
MHRFIALVLLPLAFAVAADALAQRAIPADRIVAVVNDEAVTATQLRDAMERVVGQLRRQGVDLPPREVLEDQVLERLVLERAQLQLARENGITVDEATMQRAITRIGDNAGLNEEELREALRRDGLSWERFREDLRKEILITRLREREVDSRIVVTEAEIDNYLANAPEPQESERELLVAHILLRVAEDAGEEEVAAAQRTAADILERHAAGEAFQQLAIEFSDAPDARDGGVIGWRQPERLPALFAEAVEGLARGDVSEVLRSAAGLHIVKLVDTRGGPEGDQVEQTRARHILMRTTEVLPDAEVRARLEGLRERIVVGGESFEDLAKVHSDDLSAARGGDLGWILPGDTVPEFERAMDALEPGEVSEPVRSPFGWHLIQVVERRVQDVSEDRLRAQARNALRQRKSDEAYESWLRELRDTAYIDIRLLRD